MSFILLGILNSQAAGAAGAGFIGLAIETSPYVAAYTNAGGNWGVKIADPTGTLPASNGQGVSFDRTSETIAVTDAEATNSLFAWPISASGFGTKYSFPSVTYIKAGQHGVHFSPTNDYVAWAANGRGANAYDWTVGTGFGTQYNIATSSDMRSIRFSNAGDAVVFATQGGTRAYAALWSNPGFGSLITPSTSGIDSGFQAPNWRVGDTDITIGQDSQMNIWPWTGSAFGSKYSQPVGGPITAFGSTSFESVSGNYLVAAGGGSSPYTAIWPFTTGTGLGTVLSAPATALPGNGRGAFWSYDGESIIIGHENSPYVSWYNWTGTAWGSKKADPATLPGATARQAQFTLPPA